jgi:excisionase family DNA binding protein
MKHRSIQFGTRRNPESPRVDSLRLAANSSSAPFRGKEDSYETRDEPYSSQPPMSSSERNRGQVESDAGFEPLLDVVEAARLLRIHPKTLQKLTRIGRVPAYRVGRFWRYRGTDLEMWLQSGANSNRQPADRVDFTQEKTQ